MIEKKVVTEQVCIKFIREMAVWECKNCGSRFESGSISNTKVGDRMVSCCLHCNDGVVKVI